MRGFMGVVSSIAIVIMGRAGIPRDIVAALNGAIQRALASPELRKRYEDWTAIFGRISRNAGIKPQ